MSSDSGHSTSFWMELPMPRHAALESDAVCAVCIVGAGTFALSMPNLSGPVRKPTVGSKYSVTWKSLTCTWIGCSSLL